MPGRQSTGAPPHTKHKSKGRKKDRSLNALAIAEKQVPKYSKLPKDYAEKFEGHTSKRQREREDRESEREGEVRKGKKRKGGHEDRKIAEFEHGSDSDGNEWIVGGVDSNEDSELDSDKAFGESDEEKFEDFTLRGSSTVRTRIKPLSKPKSATLNEDGSRDIDLHEDGGSIETSEQSDGFGDDAVDLAAILDDSDEHTNDGKKNMIRPDEGHHDTRPGNQVTYVDSRKSPEGDEDSIFTNSDMEDDQPNSSQLESLKKLVSNMDSQNNYALSQTSSTTNAQEAMPPSQFGINSTRKLTVADLIPSITDSNLKKSLKLLVNNDAKISSKPSGISKKLDVPLPKRQQDRLNRAAAYDKSKETLNRWIDTVKYNRRAEHLAFPLQDPNAVAAAGVQKLLPAIHSQPLTELEGVIQNILQDSGLAPKSQELREDQADVFDGLETNKLSVQEVQARRAELRRARELLFREEIRSRRIKRIKSKSYRRVHRKEREKIAQQEKVALAAAGVESSESEQERMNRRRAEERVGARHRESKWAKSVKDSGRTAWDENARSGIVEAARRGDELTKRVQGRDVRTDESSPSSSDSDSDGGSSDEFMDETRASLQKLHDRVKKLDSYEMPNSSKVELKSGLSSMKFMQKADALRKEKNDADIDLLRRVAAGEDTPNEEEAELSQGRRHFGPKKTQRILSPSFEGKTSNDFDEKDCSLSVDESRGNVEDEDQQILVNPPPTAETQNPWKRARIAQENKRGKRGMEHDAPSDKVENPWLGIIGLRRDDLHTRASQAETIISTSLAADGPLGQVRGSKAQQALEISRHAGNPQKTKQTHEKRNLAEAINSESDDEESRGMPPLMRDQDLIRKAFAGDAVVADFEKEKQDITRAEEEQVIDNSLPGWGSWTGAGISKKEQKQSKGRFLSKVDGIQREKRKDAKLDRVIINEKRVLKVCHLKSPCGSSAQYCRTSNTSRRPYHTLSKTDSNMKGPFGYL